MHLSIEACRRYVYVKNPEEAYKGTSFSPRSCITILNNARRRRLLFRNDAKNRADGGSVEGHGQERNFSNSKRIHGFDLRVKWEKGCLSILVYIVENYLYSFTLSQESLYKN